MPYFHEVAAQHPEMLRRRGDLSFSRDSVPGVVAQQWRQSGVVMLREVLSPEMLAGCRRTFDQFIETAVKKNGNAQPLANGSAQAFDDGPGPEWANGETIHGSWHLPWTIRHGGQFPLTTVLSPSGLKMQSTTRLPPPAGSWIGRNSRPKSDWFDARRSGRSTSAP